MFTLEFSTDNAAFGDNAPDEIARILRTVADRIADNITTRADAGAIRDANGNRIGEWSYEPSADADEIEDGED